MSCRFRAALSGRPGGHRGQEFLLGDGLAFLLLQAACQESEQSPGVFRKFLGSQFSVLVTVEPVEELLASSLFIGPLLLAAVTGPAAILLSSADLLPAVHRGEIFSREPILAELLEVAGDAWTGLLGKFFGSQLAVPVAVKSLESSRRDGVDSPLLSRLGLVGGSGGAGLEIREIFLTLETLVVVSVGDPQQSTKRLGLVLGQFVDHKHTVLVPVEPIKYGGEVVGRLHGLCRGLARVGRGRVPVLGLGGNRQ